MAIGYVYVLTNSAMPGLVKIGFTQESASVRARQIFTTGVPTPFQVEYFHLTDNVVEVEAALHKTFESKRVNAGREFFQVHLTEAVLAIQKAVNAPETSFLRAPLKALSSEESKPPRRRWGPGRNTNAPRFAPSRVKV
jgi:T5orf172 domain